MGQPKTELTSYIWTYLQQGYSLASIKDQLIAQGYDKGAINAAVDYVYANYYYSKQPKSPQQPRYVTQAPHFSATNHVLLIVLVLFGIGLLVAAITLIVLGTSNETSANNIPPNQIIIPDNSNNDNSGPSNNDASDNTNNNGIAPNSTNAENTPEKIILEEQTYNPNERYTKKQLDTIIEATAPKDHQEALKFCTEYSTSEEREYCISTVAELSAKVELCTEIKIENTKDDCYLKIVLDENADGTYCNNIQNAYKRENCLRFIEALGAQEASKNIEIPESNPEEPTNSGSVTAEFY